MSYGQPELYALLTDSSVTSLLTDGAAGVWYDTVVPPDTGNADSVVNYYRTSPVQAGLDILLTTYSVNCRATSMAEAEAIASAIVAVVNRHSYDSVFFVCDILPVIPEGDPTDTYNAPIEVVTKGRDI